MVKSGYAVTRRRRVDWPIILGLGRELPAPRVVDRAEHGKLASLLSAFDEILALDDPDVILRRAVELARERIGLARVGVFLLDRGRNLMLGTWGTDMHGALVDEHNIMYDVSDTDREAFRRFDEEAAHFTVFEDCPIVEHRKGETVVVGRGWVACTPIRSARARIGILFNDTGLSGEPVDEAKQTHAAILCSLLGTVLDPVRGSPGRGSALGEEAPGHRMVTATVGMLAKDPALGGKEIASRLDISLSRLARVFKAEMGMSLVEYRNRLRLDRFMVLLDRGRTNLLEAALAAGFGSYAQFHRVFRALRHATPREYLRRRT
jgi:AraC-like DNA-binding protein